MASAQDAPGSEPDPVEKRITIEGTDQLITRLGDYFVNPTPEDKAELEETDFLRAILDTRFIPEEPGAEHTPESVHVRTLAAQFESADGAETGLDLIHKDSLRPCPEICATQISEFDVGEIPDAHGVRRLATAEDIAEIGEEGRPFDRYEVQFADGPFSYVVSLDGAPGEVSQQELEEIAGRLYERVKGAPAPE